MPVVHIHLEPRDDENKARIVREVSAAIADVTNSSVDEVMVIFHDHEETQSPRGIDCPQSTDHTATESPSPPGFITVYPVTIKDEAEFVGLRNSVVNPILARQPGFVSTALYRMREPKNGYLLMNGWMTEGDWIAWAKTEEDRTTGTAQRKIADVWNPLPFDTRMEIVPQRFGTV